MPSCFRRSDDACTSASPTRSVSSDHSCCRAPTGPVSSPSISTAPVISRGAFTALLAAADASETVAPGAALRHLERAFELWDAAGGAASGDRRSDRLWQAAELASGTASNERAAVLAREAFRHGPPPRGVAWGHERLGRYLWASGHLDESTVEFEAAAALIADEAGSEAAAVLRRAGSGRADARSLRLRRSASAACLRAVADAGGRPAGVGDGPACPGNRRGLPG